MLGIASIGRTLIIRQLLLTGVVLALGGVAYSVGLVSEFAPGLAVDDPKAAMALAGAVQTTQAQVLLVTAIVAILMAVASAALVHLTIGRPMKRLAATAAAMADGAPATVESRSRNDEIDQIAQALRRLRRRLAELETPAAPAVNDQRQPRLVVAMSQKVERLSAEMGLHAAQLSAMTRRLSGTSEKVIVASRHAADGSNQATTASSNAAGDVSSVATASEQLLDSIEEISRQVVQSTSVVKAAVERAVETNDGMGRLSAAAQKVGDVVSLISRIAAQTNLLALNATIEAARAGEAGRGFAVVAQEVKTLATQTAKATQDITGQILEMQEATELSVDAIDKIQKKISEVEHISTIIAAAVHEQGAATHEIARNVRSAAAGTVSITSHVESITRSVDETSANATSLAGLAREFDEMARTITGMVGQIDAVAKDLLAA